MMDTERKYSSERGRRRRSPEAEVRIEMMAAMREEVMSLRKIGRVVGLSGERVRQLLESKD